MTYWQQRQGEQRERARQRAARTKHLRQMLNKRGFYAVLRQVAEGGDAIRREAQLRILKVIEDTVRSALQYRPHDGSRPVKRKPRDPRLDKLEALMRDPAATDGERAAAREAAERLRARPR